MCIRDSLGAALTSLAGEVRVDLIEASTETIVETLNLPAVEDEAIQFEIDAQGTDVHAAYFDPEGQLRGIAAFAIPPPGVAGYALPVVVPDAATIPGGSAPTTDFSSQELDPLGYWSTREDLLALHIAEQELLSDCFSAAGLDFVYPTDQELVELHGSWRPHGVLGVGRGGAAGAIGYQDSGWGGAGSPSQSAASDALSLAEQTERGSAFETCWPEVDAALGKTQRLAELSRFGGVASEAARWLSHPVLADALVRWRACLVSANVDSTAQTPNELRRQFGFDSTASQEERRVAIADVRCQAEARLESGYYIAQTEGLRAELGDEAHLLDELAALNLERLQLAQAVLSERGLVAPSLD